MKDRLNGARGRNARMAVGLVITLAVMACGMSAHSIDTLSYAPAEVTITGVVVQDTFPGPPNFEKVALGDTPEVYWVLRLSNPIAVRGVPNDDMDIAESNLDVIQLVFADSGLYGKYRQLLDRKVNVTGRLMHAMSAHHHTRVLLIVRAMTGG